MDKKKKINQSVVHTEGGKKTPLFYREKRNGSALRDVQENVLEVTDRS